MLPRCARPRGPLGARRGLAVTADEALANAARTRPLPDLAREQWPALPPSRLEPYGFSIAKLLPSTEPALPVSEKSSLVLVTAMSPTKAGEGKTCTSVGLSDALRRVGKRATVCLREPSLGPVFGMKGGAAGGGRSQLVPMVDINLHFTGDIHAVGAAHNLLAAIVDNHLHWGQTNPAVDPRRIAFGRVVDMQDRALRDIVIGLGGPTEGVPRQTFYQITVASEVMAVLCLATDLNDLQERLGRIVVGYGPGGKGMVTAKDLGVAGAMTALLVNAMRPNVVQSLENTLAFVHGGPFANIAHGCSSVAATKAAMSLSDFVVTEAGFGADLGAEKFVDIKCRQAGLAPKCAVVVATVRALKMHGGVGSDRLALPDVAAVNVGMGNLARHLENVAKMGLPRVVAINLFPTDSPEEIHAVVQACAKLGVLAVPASHYAKGGEGAVELAKAVVGLCDANPKPSLQFVYPLEAPLADKIRAVATQIYRAKDVQFEQSAQNKLAKLQADGFGNLPVCIAKNQYSFSDDPLLLNAPEGHTLHVSDVRLSAGAGFVVVTTGSVMTMPGLPKAPSALKIGVDHDGKVFGMF